MDFATLKFNNLARFGCLEQSDKFSGAQLLRIHQQIDAEILGLKPTPGNEIVRIGDACNLNTVRMETRYLACQHVNLINVGNRDEQLCLINPRGINKARRRT